MSLIPIIAQQSRRRQPASDGSNSGGVTPYYSFGDFINQSFSGAAVPAGFTANGGMGVAVSGGNLSFTGSGADNGSGHNLLYTDKGASALCNYYVQSQCKRTGGTSTIVGMVGRKDSLCDYWAWVDEADKKVYIGVFSGGVKGSANYASTTAFMGAVNGDEYIIRLNSDNHFVEAVATNVRTSETLSIKKLFSAIGLLWQRVGNPGLATYADAAMSFKSFTYGTNDVTAADTVFFGDSITRWEDNYVDMIAAALPSKRFIKCASPGANTGDVQNCTAEIIALAPKKVFMMLGINDILQGITADVAFTRLQTITNNLVAAGLTVRHLLVTPTQGYAGVTTVNNSIKAAYPLDYIDTNTPLNNGIAALKSIYDYGDGIHLKKPEGDTAVKNTIISYI